MMQMTIKKQIGKKTITFFIEGKNLHELQMEAQKLSFQNVYKCGVCESDNLYLYAYITEKENYHYIKIMCADCKSSVTFGQPKTSPDTFYLRKNDDGSLKWETYEKDSKSEKEEKDDLPF